MKLAFWRKPKWIGEADCPSCDQHYAALPPMCQMTVVCTDCKAQFEIMPEGKSFGVYLRQI